MDPAHIVRMEDPDMNTARTLITTLVLGGLAAGPALADTDSLPRASKQESIGIGSGLVVGALAAGPVGAILGAATGALLGDRLHRDHTTMTGLESALAEARTREGHLDARVAALSDELGVRERMLHDLEQTTARIGESVQFSVPFRTSEASLPPEVVNRLARLGRVLVELGDVEIQVEGHADARGEDRVNLALSAARAETVRAVLLDAGLASEQVHTIAHGSTEARADADDPEGLAFDRRVDIQLVLNTQTGRFARRD